MKCNMARTYASAYGCNTQWNAAQISGAYACELESVK